MYLFKCTRLQDPVVPLPLKLRPKEDVVTESAREDPGDLGGVRDTPTHLHFTPQGLQLLKQALQQARL